MSRIRISPVVLLVIVILAVGFFILGLIQLLLRCFIKNPSFSSVSRSNSLRDVSHSHSLQRQLQHLFRLHDSGLDQAVIDVLPVFCYKDMVGVKEPFDCAVCLCEFSDGDRLKLIPNCSHAFHIHCIETWLLSNTTCPLCRSLISCNNLAQQRTLSHCPDEANNEHQENAGPARVISVRLGKFRNTNEGLRKEAKGVSSSSSSSTIDARRCFSMDTCQYVINDANLLVALMSSNDGACNKPHALCFKDQLGNNATDGKRIGVRSRGDSFSLSKIWLWSKKGMVPNSDDPNEGVLPIPGQRDLASRA